MRCILAKNALVSHKFIEKVIEHVRSNRKVQPSTQKIAARTALDFAICNSRGRFEDSEEVGRGELCDSIEARRTTDANLARANAGDQAVSELAEQDSAQRGRGDSAPTGNAADQEADASRVVQDVLELVITRKG